MKESERKRKRKKAHVSEPASATGGSWSVPSFRTRTMGVKWVAGEVKASGRCVAMEMG